MSETLLTVDCAADESVAGTMILRIAGDVDIVSAVQLSEAIRLAAASAEREVVLDFLGVEFIDSSGLRAIVTSRHELADAGLVLSVGGLSGAAHRLLELTGLIDQLRRTS